MGVVGDSLAKTGGKVKPQVELWGRGRKKTGHPETALRPSGLTLCGMKVPWSHRHGGTSHLQARRRAQQVPRPVRGLQRPKRCPPG